jgi:plastocyanin
VLRMARKAVPLGLLMVVLAQGSAYAATVNVNIVSSPSPGAFSPATANLIRGDTVHWTNTTGITHTTTGDSPLNYWNSGNLANNATFNQPFPVAGSYAYHCNIHPSMLGTVKVVPTASPTSGTTTTVFTITWAGANIPAGFEADVALKRPGGSYAAWMTRRSGAQVSAQFTPDAGTGNYIFVARLRKLASGSPASGWAPVVVHVT